MSLVGTVASVAAPAIVKYVLAEPEPLPINDAQLEAQYLRARSELEAWRLEDESDWQGMMLSGAAGFIAALFTPR